MGTPPGRWQRRGGLMAGWPGETVEQSCAELSVRCLTGMRYFTSPRWTSVVLCGCLTVWHATPTDLLGHLPTICHLSGGPKQNFNKANNGFVCFFAVLWYMQLFVLYVSYIYPMLSYIFMGFLYVPYICPISNIICFLLAAFWSIQLFPLF